jgi:hypothetical protein
MITTLRNDTYYYSYNNNSTPKLHPNPYGGDNGKMWWQWQGYGGVEYDGDDKVQDKTRSRT